MVTFWLNGEETSSETESALEQGQKEKHYFENVLKVKNKVVRKVTITHFLY